ncbi:hypothetical protein C4573_01980 [Candidatus Woesearchaeota archaeon]|nr:MAG: hypothetical protein C4573_01980 [Candidatus Woesearchaeota archaeon]
MIASIVDRMTTWYPELKKKIKLSGIHTTPQEFVAKNLKNSLVLALCMTILSVFFILKKHGSFVWIPVVFVLFTLGFFHFMMKVLDAAIIKRRKEIDQEVLFAGRYLLIKLNSGMPLVNSLIEASKSYGASDKYFKDIVRDIELGTPIEEALENAMKYTPSKKFKKILFQINNALRIGIDVTDSLEAVLDEIAQEQLLEIQRYGRKLNSFTMFYMLIAIVIPSLGMTLAVVIASITNIAITLPFLMVILFFLIVLQFFFIAMFHSIRPKVNL